LQQRVFINDTNSYAIIISGVTAPYINYVTITPQQYSGAIYYNPPNNNQQPQQTTPPQLIIENSQFNLNLGDAIYVRKNTQEMVATFFVFKLVLDSCFL
jgi:hypothetical protein